MKLGWTRPEVSGSGSQTARAMAGDEHGDAKQKRFFEMRGETHGLEGEKQRYISESKPSSFKYIRDMS